LSRGVQIRLISILAPFCTSNLNRRSLVPTPWAVSQHRFQLQPATPEGEQRAQAPDMLLIKILAPMQRRLPTAGISRTFESYDKLKRRMGQSARSNLLDWEGSVPFAWSPGREAVVIIGTELPAGLGQDGVRPRKRIHCGGLPAVALSVCLQYVCSLSAVCQCGRRVKGHGSWVLVGIKTGLLVVLGLGLLGFWALDRLQCSTAQHSTAQYSTVLNSTVRVHA
jgi:hypothetical protein